MRSIPAVPALLVAAVLVGALGFQQHRIDRLASQVQEVQRALGTQTGEPAPAPETPTTIIEHPSNATDVSLTRRLTALEQAVEQLTEANDHLMNRGQLPLTAGKREQLLAQLENPSAEDRERLQALRLLRRNGSIPDAALQAALN